jgi:succinylglutamate desuccinylase
MLEQADRLIGRYTGTPGGPLMICIAGIHGNEPAGVHALDLIFKMLEVEPITNPTFEFFGRMIGLRGNINGLERNVRFVDNDLNRIWTPEHIETVKNRPRKKLKNEDLDLRDILDAIEEEIHNYQPDEIVVIDLHTTSCEGGIFSLVRDDPDSIEMGIELHAPVVRGMLNGLTGTTLHYFHEANFDIPITSITFESGQHDEPLSINRAIAGIINCMRTIGCVREEDVENRHDSLLIEHGNGLPKVTHLVHCHDIVPEDKFVMKPGFKNFDSVIKGMHIADDIDGPIYAEFDGLLLMPLYQDQGDEGYFIIEPSDFCATESIATAARHYRPHE